jgi:peptidoglycan/LPS O-acetylase OafA/YrhL
MIRGLGHRPDIDGLRAIAVLSVVLYHLGIGGLTGGFVGVDIFFVISGFLISRIIYAEVHAGSFSVAQFYERRARRILPAFFVATIGITIAASAILMPPEVASFAQSLMASVLFSSNVFFYATSGYFAPSAENLPLLHYWSLGVEEQFYILFPLLIILIVRWSSRLLFSCLALLFTVSLILAQVMLRKDPSAVFYLLPFRSCELLIGSLLALPSMQFPIDRRLATVATLSGLCLVGVAVLTFNTAMPFPGVTALLPCVGTALIIGGGAVISNPISWMLSLLPLVLIGRISYSLYLVHWPLIVFAKRLYPYADPIFRSWTVLAISIGLAAILYAFVEQPVRRNRRLWTARTILGTSLSGTAVIAAAAFVAILNQGVSTRLDTKIQDMLAFLNYDFKPVFRSGVGFLDPEQAAEDIDLKRCLPQDDRRKALLWGDSHAAHLYAGLREPMALAGYSLGMLAASACPPILGIEIPQRPNCRSFNEFVLKTIVTIRPDKLILEANWPLSGDLINRFEQTLSALNEAGFHPIVLGDGPVYRIAVPTLLAERWMHGNFSPFSDADLMMAILTISETSMRARFSRRRDVKYVSIIDAVCPDYRCPMMASAAPVHFDEEHLTAAGSRLFGAALIPKLLQ